MHLNLINSVAENYNIDTIFLLCDDNTTFLDLQTTRPMIKLRTNSPKIVFKESYLIVDKLYSKNIPAQKPLSKSFTNNILTVLELQSEPFHKDLMSALLDFLRYNLQSKVIIFLKDTSNVRQFLHFCWESGLSNVLVVLQNNKMYSFNPYPRFHIIAIQSPNYFPAKWKNVRWHTFHVFFDFNGLLCVFPYIDQQSHVTLSGAQYQIYSTFIRKIQGKMFLHFHLPKKSSPSSYPVYDFVPCSIIYEPKVSFATYYLETYSDSIIFPLMREVDKQTIFILPFDTFTWIITLALLIILAAVRKRWLSGDFFLELLESSKVIMCQGIKDNSSRLWALQFVTFAYGFVISNIYLNIFGNINQFSAMKVNSINSLARSGIEVVGCPVACNIENPYFDLPKGITVNPNIKVDTYNVKYAYYLKPGMFESFKEVQKFKNIKLFGLLENNFKQHQFSFSLIDPNSPFKSDLNHHILAVYSSGLINKWKSDTARMIVRAGMKDRKHEVLELDPGATFAPLSATDLQIPLFALAFGLIIAFLCFIGEVLYSRFEAMKAIFKKPRDESLTSFIIGKIRTLFKIRIRM